MSTSAITLTGPAGGLSATFLPGLGMVCSSLSHDGSELLAQRGGPDAYRERGSSFAIPLLYPWANRLSGWDYSFDGVDVELNPHSPLAHKDEHGLPRHGVLAACRDWALTDVTETRIEARLDYGADPERFAAFPFPHVVTYSAAISDTTLAIVLEVEPTSHLAVPVSFGFHPYLTLPGSDRRDWQIKLPVRGGALDGPLGDRVFDDPCPELAGDEPSFSVEDPQRRLSVQFRSGYPVAQVYAPPGSDFICFEPMTAPIDALRSGERLPSVRPGRDFRAVFSINVESL